MNQAFVLLIGIVLFPVLGLSQSLQRTSGSPESPGNAAGLPRYSLLNINNITTWMRSDGQSSRTPQGNEGVYFPRGTRWTAYQDGFVWGAKAYTNQSHTQPAPSQLIRIGGGTFNIGTVAGRVIGFGPTAVPQNPNDPDVRMYRIRRDYVQLTQDELRRDAAEFHEIVPADVTQSQINALLDQYQLDWNEWPVQHGAPYIERNGVPGFQPPPPFGPNFTVDSLIVGNYDEPGLAGASPLFPADQVLWCVYNDLNPAVTSSLYGSEPLGLEAQVTLWGYKRTDALGSSYLKRIRLINKGGVPVDTVGSMGAYYLDSVFVALWADPDIGNFTDDLAGCDSVLHMGFAYNGFAIDAQFSQLNLPPPAFGYTLVQGALIPGASGDSAIFDFRRIGGKRNVPMTSFAVFSAGSAISDPPFTREGGLRWWRMLQGYVPDPSTNPYRLFPHPPGDPETRFPLSGNPMNGTGFVDGYGASYSLPPGDRRIVINSGPFRLAPGDTQEVIIMGTGGLGADRLSSVAAMKQNAQIAAASVRNLLLSLPPVVTSSVSYPTGFQATVRLHARAGQTSVQSMEADLLNTAGTLVASLVLYDDGTHGDSLAGDGLWTNEVTIGRQLEGLSVRLTVVDGSSATTVWPGIHTGITTVGPVSVRSVRVFSDNGNDDGQANAGEAVRYGFTVANLSIGSFSQLRVAVQYELDGKVRTIPSLPIAGIDSMIYSPSVPMSFLTVIAPDVQQDSMWILNVTITDGNDNRWDEQITMLVRPYGFVVNSAQLNHISGFATGSFDVVILDPPAVLNHLYVFQGEDSVGSDWVGFTLKDSTDGRIVLRRSALPDPIGFNIPVTDGFRVRLGTLETHGGMKGWDVPSGELRFSWVGGQGFPFTGFNGTIDWDDPRHVFGGGIRAVPAHRLRNVLIRFANASSSTNGNPGTGDPYGGWDREATTDPNMSYAYRWLRAGTVAPAYPDFAPFIVNPAGGYAYQDYRKGMPFSAWDVDTDPPRRLAVGFLENNVLGGLVDGLYWPPPSYATLTNTAGSGPREWFFILDADYTDSIPDPVHMVEMIGNPVPVMWWGTVTRESGNNFATGDEFLIVARKVISRFDKWTFNPTILVGVDDEKSPVSFALYQNYPNPFNPATIVRYSLPHASRLTIRIYNIVGQEVKTLVDADQEVGEHVARWDGTNNREMNVGSGVYFYRIEARSMENRSRVFRDVKKMMLLR